MGVPPKRSIFPSNLAMRYNRGTPSVRPNFKFCPREDFTEEPHAKAFAESRDFEIFGVPPSKRKIFDFKIPPRKSRGYSGARRRSQTRASDGRPALKSAPQRRILPTRQAPERADQKDAPCAAEGLSKAPTLGRFSELRAPHSARYCPAAHAPPGADSPEPFAMPLFKEKNVFSSREHSSSSTPPSTAREWLRVGRS